jgi:hypothetical protein
MGVGVFGNRDKRNFYIYFLIVKTTKPISYPLTYQRAPSLLESSAEMKGNIHVCSSWMMNKAM